jgi:hypothetical protein
MICSHFQALAQVELLGKQALGTTPITLIRELIEEAIVSKFNSQAVGLTEGKTMFEDRTGNTITDKEGREEVHLLILAAREEEQPTMSMETRKTMTLPTKAKPNYPLMINEGALRESQIAEGNKETTNNSSNLWDLALV